MFSVMMLANILHWSYTPRFEPWYHQRKTTCLLFLSEITTLFLRAVRIQQHICISQNQGWTNFGSGAKWAICLHIIWMGCWVQIVDLILNRSAGLEWAFGQLTSKCLRWPVWILVTREETTYLDSKSLPCAKVCACMYVCKYVLK